MSHQSTVFSVPRYVGLSLRFGTPHQASEVPSFQEGFMGSMLLLLNLKMHLEHLLLIINFRFIDAIWCEAVMSLNGCDEDETIRILAGPTYYRCSHDRHVLFNLLGACLSLLHGEIDVSYMPLLLTQSIVHLLCRAHCPVCADLGKATYCDCNHDVFRQNR
ncbi:hypothetical protein Tco_0322102 [Tanacetum coccineum]